MGGRRQTPVFTENFSANLEAIRVFLGPEGAGAFTQLLHRILDEAAPTLCRFPQAGRSVLAQPIRSLEARGYVKRLRSLLRAGDELREFILDDYLILYLVRPAQVAFLAIKHHRQLSFDLSRFWGLR
jgi:plasmid stabilization system protein ParE